MDLNYIPNTAKIFQVVFFLLLYEYNMLINSFSSLGLAYQYLLTLSVTQVACERSFSTLKLIKTRIRSTINQDRLESFMLMMCEYEIVCSMDNEKIIDKIANHSAANAKLLKI